MFQEDDHFADFDEASTSTPYTASSGHSGERRSREVFSEKISTKYRTFFVDVKENTQGRLVKISEKSRGGQKSTIMMDSEDLIDFIAVLNRAKDSLK